MLPAAQRLTDPAAFSDTVRSGRRAGSRALVVHLTVDRASTSVPRLGLVVSKAVGNAVVRNRVKRRLRHLAAIELAKLPVGSIVVLRALPAAADATWPELSTELRTGLARCAERTPEMTTS